MANYIFDPDDYTVGTSLKTLGWTQRWRTAASAWDIVADERASGSTRTLLSRNVIKFVADGATNGRRALSWDAIDSDADRANTEILLVGLKPGLNTTTGNIRAMIRGSGADGAEDGYAHGLVVASTTSMAVRWGEYNAGSAGSMTTSASTSGDHRDIWIALRVRINGDQHWTKRWIPTDPLDPEADEPGEWTQGPTSDTSVSAAGWVGLFHFDAAPALILKFAAATNGDTATFTTSAPSGDEELPELTVSITISALTTTSYTATWPAGSDNVAVTGYEYRIAAGSWVDRGNNLSVDITGRTPGATESFELRAYDAAGNRSTPALSTSVTLLSESTDGTITVGSALYPIKYASASVLNESGLRATVLDATTLAQVLNTSGVVCASGVITITDAALVIGNTYHLAVKTADGWLGVSDAVTAA